MNKSKEFNFLKNLIENKNAYIGIIGLGYVGLPLAMTFAESEFNVLGIDIDKKKVNSLNAFKSYINHIPDKKIEKFRTANSSDEPFMDLLPENIKKNDWFDTAHKASMARDFGEFSSYDDSNNFYDPGWDSGNALCLSLIHI